MAFVEDDGRGPFVGNDGRGPFRMGERDADDVLDENHEAKRFFPTDGHNPAAPFPSFPQALSHPSRSPFLVIPAESPFCHSRSF